MQKIILNTKVMHHEKGSIENVQFGRNVGQTYWQSLIAQA
jgi:hypothetical protein